MDRDIDPEAPPALPRSSARRLARMARSKSLAPYATTTREGATAYTPLIQDRTMRRRGEQSRRSSSCASVVRMTIAANRSRARHA
jgi:hypothetical protein